MAHMMRQVHKALRKCLCYPKAKVFSGGLRQYVGFYVPSTRKTSIKIKPSTFRKRTRNTERFFASRFGGETTIPTIGGFIDKKGRLIRERVNIVRAYGTTGQLRKYSKSVRRQAVKDKKAWKQESFAVEESGRLKFI